MKTLFTILSLILLVSIFSFTQAQTDTVKTDKVYMLDGSTIDGKVKTVKNDIVVFTEKETGVDYEINKSDIKVIILGNGKPLVFTETKAPVSTVVAPSVVATTEPTTTTTNTTTTQTTPPETKTDEIQFSLAGYLAGSLQNWSVETDESTLGFGLSGDLLAGIIWEEMYFGIGPHFGGSWWTVNETIYGYSATATTSVSDFGLDLAAAWDGFFFTVGWGSGSVSITAEVAGQSESYDYPEGIGYTRLMLGWYDGFLFGLAFTSYSDNEVNNNLDRAEICLGWAF